MAKYRKKPVVIEAVQWTGNNEEEIKNFAGIYAKFKYLLCNGNGYMLTTKKPSEEHTVSLEISTLEGNMTAKEGDYIIKGVNGEFYPCKPDVFNKTYEKMED